MLGLGAGEVLLIMFLALIFIGPKKLPELAKGLGKGVREFQKAKNDFLDELERPKEVEGPTRASEITEVPGQEIVSEKGKQA